MKGLLPSTSFTGCYWIRSLPNDPHSQYTYIEGSENNDRYVLTAQDENCFISFQQTISTTTTTTDEDNEQAEIQTLIISRRAFNSIGPVLPGPPRLLDLSIMGNFKPGKIVYVEGEYIGGTQGLSEYWWFRIKGGKRIQIGEPRSIDQSISLNEIQQSISKLNNQTIQENDQNERIKKCLNDPRILILTDEDIGCVLKVKCRPIRADGYKGEVFTSKPSPVITIDSMSIENLTTSSLNQPDENEIAINNS